jgi:hypothetical protein
MLNLSLCLIQNIREFPVAVGVNVTEEGMVLCSSLVSGEETAKFYTTGSDRFLGYSYGCVLTPVYKSFTEDITAPASAPYTATLTKSTPITGQVFGWNTTSGSLLTLNADFSMDTSGNITFLTAGTYGCSIRFTYRYTPTVAEIQSVDRMNILPVTEVSFLSSVGVVLPSGGENILYTNYFDASINWAAATGLKAAANGLTVDNNGTGITIPNGVVYHIPTPDIPFLGIRF